MTRDGLIEVNETKETAERVSRRHSICNTNCQLFGYLKVLIRYNQIIYAGIKALFKKWISLRCV